MINKDNMYSGPRRGGIKSKPTTVKPNISPCGISGFGGTSNMSFTSSKGTQIKLDLAVLLKVMKDIPKCPRIFTMDIKLLEHPLLDGNIILISRDIAKVLEEVMGE